MIEIVTEQNDDDPVETALAEFAAAWYEGEKPDVDRFLRSHEHCGPELSRRVREFISTAEILRLGQSGARSGRVRGGVTGELLGEFRIIREVGRGGMGVVYLAEQRSLRRHVAIKVLPAHLTLRADTVERFRREASTAASLRHPGIVEIHSVGEQNGTHYFAMAFVEGTGLDRVIEHVRGEPLDRLTGETIGAAVSHHVQLNQSDVLPRRDEHLRQAKLTSPVWNKTYIETVCRLIVQIADALDHAHKAGVIHRDVKPSNILVREDGVAVLTDFGLAREQGLPSLTLTGEFAGTPDYVSPEQAVARRAGIDHRTDIYSLGVTLFELLTLRRPFEGVDSQEILHKIRTKEPPPPRKFNPMIPRDLQTIVLKAIEKDPSRRYQDMAAFAADLRALLEYRPVTARPTSPVTRMLKLAKRHRGSVTAGLLVCAAILALFAYQWMRPSYLHIQCDVEDAAIWLDGREVGRTMQADGSMRLEVAPGFHTLRATKGIDASKPTVVRMGRGDTQSLPITLISGSGFLALRSNPTGAEVTITRDGQEQGKYVTPNHVWLPAGRWDATFELKGFATERRPALVPNEGREVTLACDWDTGELELQGLQDGIQVEVFARDASAQKVATVTLPNRQAIRLPVGKYRIVGRLRNHDWRTYDPIEILKDRRTQAALWLPPFEQSAVFGNTQFPPVTLLSVEDLEGDGVPEFIFAQPSGEVSVFDARGTLKREGKLIEDRAQVVRRVVAVAGNSGQHKTLLAGTNTGTIIACDAQLELQFTHSFEGGWLIEDLIALQQDGVVTWLALLKSPNPNVYDSLFASALDTSDSAASRAPGPQAFSAAIPVPTIDGSGTTMIAWGLEQVSAFDGRGTPRWERRLAFRQVIRSVIARQPSAKVRTCVVALTADRLSTTWPNQLLGWSADGDRTFDRTLAHGITSLTFVDGDARTRTRVAVATDRATLVGLDDAGEPLFEVPTPGATRILVTADIDGDHVPEIVVATHDGRLAIYQHDGTLRCEIDALAEVVLPRDLNADGRDELVVLTTSRHLKVFSVKSQTSFIAPVAEALTLTTMDLDDDSRSELILSGRGGSQQVLTHDGIALFRTTRAVSGSDQPAHIPLRGAEVHLMSGLLGGSRVFRIDIDGSHEVLDVVSFINMLTSIRLAAGDDELLGIGTLDGRVMIVSANGEAEFDRYISTVSGDPRRYPVTAMAMMDTETAGRCLAVATSRGQITWFTLDRVIVQQQDVITNNQLDPVRSMLSINVDGSAPRALVVTQSGTAYLFDATWNKIVLASDGLVTGARVEDIDRDGRDEILLISQSRRVDTTWREQLSCYDASGKLRFQHLFGVKINQLSVALDSPTTGAASIMVDTDVEVVALNEMGDIYQRAIFPDGVTACLVGDLDQDGEADWVVGTRARDGTLRSIVVDRDGSRRVISDHSHPLGLVMDDPLSPQIICHDDAGHIEVTRFDPYDKRRSSQRKYLAALDHAERYDDEAATRLFTEAGLRWLPLDDAQLPFLRARLMLSHTAAAQRARALLNEVRPPADDEWLDAVRDLVRAARIGDAGLVLDEHLASESRSQLAPRLTELAWSIVAPHSPDHDGREVGLRLARKACWLTQRKDARSLSALAEAEYLSSHFDDAVKACEDAERVCPPDRADVRASLTADLARYRAALKP